VLLGIDSSNNSEYEGFIESVARVRSILKIDVILYRPQLHILSLRSVMRGV
jgi:hypothetical protein